jgi:hypothetical protein
MKLKIVLREINQAQKVKHLMFLHIYGIKTPQNDNNIY